MATTIGQKGETVSSLSFGGSPDINSLTSTSIAISAAIDFTALTPDVIDVQIELVLDPGTTTGNKKFGVYLITSLDGTNYSDTVNRSNMLWMGDVAAPDTNVVRSAALSCLAAMRGAPLPAKGKIAVWNDSGATTNSTGNTAQYREVRLETS